MALSYYYAETISKLIHQLDGEQCRLAQLETECVPLLGSRRAYNPGEIKPYSIIYFTPSRDDRRYKLTKKDDYTDYYFEVITELLDEVERVRCNIVRLEKEKQNKMAELAKPISEQSESQELMTKIETILAKNDKLTGQYRDKTKKKTFNLKNSFLLGRTTNALGAGKTNNGDFSFATAHNMPCKKGKGVCLTPVAERKLPKWKKDLWEVSKKLITKIDPDFAEGEDYVVNYSCMNDPNHYVKKHKDADDISYQYALALGDYKGATLRCYAEDDTTVLGDFDYHRKICKMDGRLSHELVMDGFEGTRYCIIWFKSYDRRKNTPDPIFNTPHFV